MKTPRDNRSAAQLAAAWQPDFSTPLLHRAFLNDVRSDENSSRFVPLGPAEFRTISVAWFVAGNYFFERRVWFGYAVAGFAYAPWGLIALAPQAIILASIFGVTGIPPTENQSLRSKGDAYAEYQRRVSRFVPKPPRA